MTERVTKQEYLELVQKSRKPNPQARTSSGWWTDGTRSYYMRSYWESNYAYYLNFLIKHGKIVSWTYEEDVFWFMSIKRGVRSYKPDFKVHYPDGRTEYHEVKGYYDKRSKTKMARMKKYYPLVVVQLIDRKKYKAITKIGGLIEGWGTPFLTKEEKETLFTKENK
jgi:hypothetical protein